MSIQAFSNEFDKQLYITKTCGAVQSNDVLAYCLLKSANLSNNHEELIKATIPEIKYDLMKGQLKKTFLHGSRHIPIKNAEVVKSEDTFLTDNFSQMTIKERFNTEQGYNPFRSTNSQHTYDQDLNTYYNRGNYHN